MDPARGAELVAAERRRIEEEMAELRAGVSRNDEEPLDRGDAGAETYDREVDLSRLEELRERLAAVERAERRLADGTYGLSVESGEPIPDRRLELFPTAERTVTEEERLRRRGG
jgi:RNA polymerase-binding transcription factor